MTKHTIETDPPPEFGRAADRIAGMLDSLQAEIACDLCVASAMLFASCRLFEEMRGSAETADIFEAVAAYVRENNHPAPIDAEPLH